jgi:transmembrane sensor
MDELKKEHFFKILEKFQEGNATAEEVQFLNAYYQFFGIKEGYTSKLNNADYLHLQERLFQDLQNRIAPSNKLHITVGKFTRYWPRIAAAAVVLLTLSSLFIIINLKNNNSHQIGQNTTHDIAPGRVGATLTLANGRKILLSEAKNGLLAKEAGVVISKSADGKLVYEIKESNLITDNLNTLSTANGETYMIVLPDQSKVWLNAASSLKYPTSFSHQTERRVELAGEAYFQISKDKAHPFIVTTRASHLGNEIGQEVEVLGTHFNINSYVDEPAIKTTLLEGSVKISAMAGSNRIQILKPKQQSTLSASGDIKVNDVDTEEAIAWKKGDFLFREEPIESVMRKLSRWYDIEVVYRGEIPKDGFQGAISRNRNISSVLKLLEQTKVAHFKIVPGNVSGKERRKIIVSK